MVAIANETISDEVRRRRDELLEKAKALNGKTVGEILGLLPNINQHDKGSIGQIVQAYLGREPNNDPTADFPEADLELKVIGLVEANHDSFRAKERLVLGMINYMKDHDIPFEENHVMKKCKAMLVVCYQYLYKDDGTRRNINDFPFVDAFIYIPSEEDEEIIRRDYDLIMSKINAGRAETLSESDTLYLAACTKGANSEVLVSQFNSTLKAKPRAFSLKPSFTTIMVKRYISNEVFESLKQSLNGTGDILEKVINCLKPYYGMRISDIERALQYTGKQKNKLAYLISKMVGVSDLSSTEEFQKANILIKTVRISANGRINEDMSFPAFNFLDVARTPFEESDTRSYFAGAKLLIPVFQLEDDGHQKDRNGRYVRTVLYNIPDIVVDGFLRMVYEKVQEVLLSGNVIKSVTPRRGIDNPSSISDFITSNNFPNKSFNNVVHVRPKGTDKARSQKPLPVLDKLTGSKTLLQQTFWFDRRYIMSILDGKAEDYLQKASEELKRKGIKFDW